MGNKIEGRRSVHEILEELLRASIASDAAVVARCIMQLESINRENTENDQVSQGNSALLSRKRSVSDDRLYRLTTMNKVNEVDASRNEDPPSAHSEFLEPGRPPRSPLIPLLARSEEDNRKSNGYTKGATVTPQGTSLDAKLSHSRFGRRKAKPDAVVDESARCANWPICLAGPAMIRDHGASKKKIATSKCRI